MSNLSKLIPLLFLIVSLHSSAQYKRMSVGLSVGTFDFSKTYVSTDLVVQYNFKKIFSVRTGVGIEQGKFLTQDFYDLGQIHYTYSQVTAKTLTVPLLFKATFGKKVYLYVMGGVQLYYNKKKHAVVTHDYPSNSSTQDYTEEVDYYSADWGISNRAIQPMYGGGVNVPLSKQWNIFAEFKKNVFKSPNSDPSEYGLTILLNYKYFSNFRFMIGATYQFNFSKKSTFTFTTFPQFKKDSKELKN